MLIKMKEENYISDSTRTDDNFLIKAYQKELKALKDDQILITPFMDVIYFVLFVLQYGYPLLMISILIFLESSLIYISFWQLISKINYKITDNMITK